MIDVIWLSYKADIPARGYWDQGMIEDIFNNKMWDPINGYQFKHTEMVNIDFNNFEIANEGAVIVFPARSQVEFADRLNEDLKRLKWVVLILTGDEEASFPIEKIDHPNIKIWVMDPRRKNKDVGRLPNGYPPQAHLIKDMDGSKRDKDWFFAGQVTHKRRVQCAKELKKLEAGDLVETESFTAGLPHEEYYERMTNAKICPCPSGPETPDTFRLYEALEAGCIPIADEQTPQENFKRGYFTFLFEEEPPFPVIRNYESLVGYVQEALMDWKNLSNKTMAWWIKYKRKITYKMADDIAEVSGIIGKKEIKEAVTVLIPTNPIPSHPDTLVLDETIEMVRHHLPNSEIIIMFDGVRDNLKHRKDDYEEYIRRVLWKCNHEWKNVLPLVFSEHEHQANMAKVALGYVHTPLILYVEHDAPVVSDCDIEWEKLEEVILKGEANVIRFHHEAMILSDHEYLMFDHENKIVEGVSMRRTMQWSQRPHLASKVFYQNMLDRYFTGDKTMIEDVVYGRLIEACKDGILGWYDWRVWIYTPEGDNIKRSYHIDGRKKDPKY